MIGLVILVFMIVSIWLGGNKSLERFEVDMKKRIVLARYKEDIEYILEDSFKDFEIWIYNKGDEIINDDIKKRCKIISLPNVGKCDHTYLYYIINEYDNLPDVTLFLPASYYYIDYKKEKVDMIIQKMKNNEGKSILPGSHTNKSVGDSLYSFVLNEYKTTFKKNQDKEDYKLLKSPIRPFGEWYKKHFNEKDCNFIMYQGIFAVSRKDIKKNQKEKYEELIKYVDHHVNPEAGHYIERIWGVLFGCD